MLSTYTKGLLEHLKQKRVTSTKRIALVENKTKYILNYRARKLYIRLGLRVTQILKILSFSKQLGCKHTLISIHKKKKTCSSEFLTFFFKLVNNSIYGKFLQNVRMYQHFVLIHRQLHFKREVAKSRFEYFTIIYEDLIGVSHTKVQLKIDKPI